MRTEVSPEVEGGGGGAIRTFLIADVRGYTVFTAERGDEAAAELASRFAAVAREGVEARDGQVIELRGDEALAVFASARQAIRAAVELQRRFVDETIADPGHPLAVGIGLDAGEAVRVGDGYRGGALNLAARLCSLAGPAEVLASREVVHLARKVDGVAYVERGPVNVKGLVEPIHVIRVRAEGADVADDTAFRRALGPAAAQLTADRRALVANPYKGLRPFEEADADYFFGREALIAQLVERLGQTRFLAVVGPSGSGKSSVVRAGLIPAIRRGALDGSSGWRLAEMFPGSHPLEELEAALVKMADDPPASLIEVLDRDERGLLRAIKRVLPADRSELVLFIDQFEEVFTLVEDEERRRHFLESVQAAVTEARTPLRVVVTLRADFYDRPLLYFGFGDLLRSRVEAVIPLSPDELERAITGPARRVDVRFEEGLVAEMLSDVADEPGALPLLQYALTELFERRVGNLLTRAAYRSLGGVTGALGRRAQELYADLDPASKEAARQLFLRLVALGEGTEDTRRPVPRSELDSLDVDRAAMTAVIDAFGAARLLSFDRDSRTGVATVEVAHEALLTAWTRLRRWIDDARDDLRTERRLALAAREWLDAGRDRSFLARGARLEQFEAWRHASEISITPQEREFLDASVDERDRLRAEEEARAAREREFERRSIRRLRTLVAALAVAAVVAGAITVFALDQRERAERERRIALARELAAASVASLEEDPERAILLALEAVRRTRGEDGTVLREAEEALHRAVTASRIVLSVRGLGGSVDWSSKGVFITEGQEDTGIVDIRDARTGDPVRKWAGHDIDVNDVGFSPDGEVLITTGDDDPLPEDDAPLGGKVKAWDAEAGELLWEVHGTGPAWSPASSEDGSLVVATWPDEPAVRIIDPADGRVVRTFSDVLSPFGAVLSPDGSSVAVPDGSTSNVLLFDVSSGEQVAVLSGHRYPVNNVAWSPDGRWIATGANDSTARIWDGDNGRLRFELRGHTGSLTTVDWSPDSTRLVTGAFDGTARIWEIGETGGREVLRLAAQESRAGLLAVFSPNAQQVMTSDFAIDGEHDVVKIWDVGLSGTAEIANVPTDDFAPVDVAFLPDGRLAAPSDRESISLWDVDTREVTRVVGPGSGSAEPVFLVDVTDDGSRIATVRNFSRTATVWDVGGGQAAYEVQAIWEISGIDFSGDGAHLAVASYDGRTTIVDANGLAVAVLKEEPNFETWAVGFSVDGSRVFTTSFFNNANRAKLTVWDWRAERVLERFDLPVPSGSIAVDPAGGRFALAREDGRVEIRDAVTGEPVFGFPAAPGRVFDITYSPDGTRIAVAGEDGTARLFDAATGDELLVLPGHSLLTSSVAFSDDGRWLASASPDGVVRIWTLDLDELIRIADRNVTRGLTDEECRQYLHSACP